MNRRVVRTERISANAELPKYQHDGDSGADVCSAIDCVLKPRERRAIPTGLKVEVPAGSELQVRSRSGLALENGIVVLNSPGTVDSGYRGEIKVVLMNLSEKPYRISIGQRIAQVVLVPVLSADFQESRKLTASDRGSDGFGSTGR